jgi:hypothetical protein
MSGVIDKADLKLIFDVLQLSALDLAAAQASITQDWTARFSNGTGAGQASQVWSDTRTLAASATEDLDLAASLVNAFGVTLTFTKIKLIAVRAAAANNVANNVNVTRPASNGVPWLLAAGDGIALHPGASIIAQSPLGWTVTPATGDLVTFTNSAGTNPVTYDVIIIGTD